MVERFTARSGAASLRIDGVALHSPYDPEREAARFVEGALGEEIPSTLVLLGEGLGYATRAVEKRLPGTRILRVFYSEEVARLCGEARHPSWHPGSPKSIADFLRASIGDLDMEGLRSLEWQPSAAAFPSVSRAAHHALRQVLQELNGSLVTTVAAGRLWIRNSVANFLLLDRPLAGRPCGPDRAILIAASGPSLERALPAIKKARTDVDLWALPSSVSFLLHAGLRPDLVVMTDPGHWSLLHLHYAHPGCPIAMPLSAARGLWRLPGQALLLLGQPSFYEEALLGAAGARPPRIAPHGTVAATAIDLALASTRGPIIAAGLDMCAEDLAVHCRPNAFDDLLRLQQSRTIPVSSSAFHQVAAQEVERLRPGELVIRLLRSLRTYAGWFGEESLLDTGRLFRLLPSPVELPRLRPLDVNGFLRLAASNPAPKAHFPPAPKAHFLAHAAAGSGLRVIEGYPDRQARQDIVRRLLGQWSAVVKTGQTDMRAGKGLAAFIGPTCLLPLAYHVDARGLLDARRKARAGRAGPAIEAAQGVLRSCAEFLEALDGRTRDA